MKKLTITLTICLLVCLAVGTAIIRKKDNTIASQDQMISEQNASIRHWTTAHGKLVAEKQAAEIRVKDLERYPEIVKTITKEFEQKLKRTRAYVQTNFEAQGSGVATITPIDLPDTVETDFQPFAIIAQDGYLDFQADVYDTLEAPYTYTYSDTVKTLFTMRGRWWERKQLYSQSMLSNPNAKVVNSTAILVNEVKDKRWGIGPYFGWGVNQDLQTNFTIGISIHRSIIKF